MREGENPIRVEFPVLGDPGSGRPGRKTEGLAGWRSTSQPMGKSARMFRKINLFIIQQLFL